MLSQIPEAETGRSDSSTQEGQGLCHTSEHAAGEVMTNTWN